MRRFVELVETARTKGISNYGAMEAGGPAFSTKYIKPYFWDVVEESQPLVFSPHIKDTVLLPQDDPAQMLHGVAKTEIDAPFKCFSVEMAGDFSLTEPLPEDREENPIWVWCVLVFEGGPKHFHFWTMCSRSPDPNSPKFVLSTNSEGPLIRELLSRLDKESVGLETVRQNIKIGLGSEKRQHRIRKVIHITPKKHQANYSISTRTIDWTHRFLVRGHWRDLASPQKVGKNRDGEYCVSGFTWVSEHERGPEEMPLIKKTRVIG